MIERDPDDLVRPWPLTGQVSAAAVFLVVAVLIFLKAFA